MWEVPPVQRDHVKYGVPLGPLHRRGVGRGSLRGIYSSGWTERMHGWRRGVTEGAGGSGWTVRMDGWPGRTALSS